MEVKRVAPNEEVNDKIGVEEHPIAVDQSPPKKRMRVEEGSRDITDLTTAVESDIAANTAQGSTTSPKRKSSPVSTTKAEVGAIIANNNKTCSNGGYCIKGYFPGCRYQGCIFYLEGKRRSESMGETA